MRSLTPSKLGRVGGQTVALYLITTAVAIVIGLITANIIAPGIGLTLPLEAEIMTKEAPSLAEVFMNIVPDNPFSAFAEGNVLQTIFIAIVFGLSLAVLQEKAEGSVKAGVESILILLKLVQRQCLRLFGELWSTELLVFLR